MAGKPSKKEFGKRRPAAGPPPAQQPVKRSRHVALLVMGTIAVGTTAYTLMPRQNCEPSPAGTDPAVQASTSCSSSRSSSSGGGSSSRSSFFSSDSSSHSSSGTSSDSGSGGVSRGGFGSFGHGFSGGG
ncbi:hypothetical protein ABIB75_005490 [Bradyrhizobium sp. GM2.2]|uniref:hypothetical protein n=1 Tax=unclassified Bradyrhizobium TaxID=2631580 RepID=UPI001FFA3E46|nr:MULTISPECIES: hypothetical protein [unclassified Bradyrhizobium]MCK1269419.1 hypothetical protein [Bradyrhizobium sp. 84]MCK1325198.1 hypothetical protein [Bradyrhizobium sp. 156]MCK1375126.1 hypothetical protein [Bradyrhizobium sp. 49]MCK1418002.1 hypothetical protein [Bradyrhizobium sp. CW4]MCK1426486.1 hypothetical protein [Bradyrhizobium sp. 87]